MQKLISDLSCSLDLFSLPISLYYHGRKKRFTFVGVFLSVCIYVFLIYNFFHSDFYQKTNPIIVSQTKKTAHAQRITFDESKMIVISVINNEGNAVHLDPSIAFFQFAVIHETANATTQVYKYDSIDIRSLHLCTSNDLNDNDISTSSLHIYLDNSYCLDNKSFAVEGGWNENDVKFAYIALNICNNKTFNGTCKSPQEIENWFKTPRFMSVQYHNARVDFYDYENPIKVE